MSGTNKHLLICGHDLKFIAPLIDYFRGCKDYSVRILEHRGHYIDDERFAQEGLDWADVIFCEWALGNAVWYSHRKRKDQTLIVRLHLQEVQARDRMSFIWQIDWEKVDRLIVITHHVFDFMRQEFPLLRQKCSLIYNPIPARTDLNVEKTSESRYTLGLVGVVPARKRLDLAVAVLRKLRASDPRFCLRVKGALPTDYPWMAQRAEEMAWYKAVFADMDDLRQDGALVFDPHGPNMNEWYRGVGHILSVSDFEGSHQAVAEGMAAGCVPAIRDWEGAARIYPPKYVRSSIDSLASLIKANCVNYISESSFVRQFAQERFDQQDICVQLQSIIERESKLNPFVTKAISCALMKLPSVLIIAYIPISSRGGYRVRVEQEISMLVQQGCKVSLVCLIPPTAQTKMEHDQARSLNSLSSHMEELNSLGCSTHVVEVEDFFRLRLEPDSFQYLTKEIAEIARVSRVDVIHAEALYCARIAVKVKELCPEIYFSIDWHGVIPEESRMGGAHENRINSLELEEKRLLGQCDLNVFVSHKMKEHYLTKYAFNDLVNVVVPCCVSDRRFVDINCNSADDGSRESIVFGYAGTMADWQCGQEMISLFARLASLDARCRFMILAPTSDHGKIREYADRYDLANRFYFLQEVSHSEVASYLQRCDVGVLLRHDDPVNKVSSPTKFGEYLAAGLPILMTDCIGDFSEMAGSSGTGFLLSATEVSDIEAIPERRLREIIRFAEKVASVKQSMARTCQAFASKHLSWESAAARWVNAYSLL